MLRLCLLAAGLATSCAAAPSVDAIAAADAAVANPIDAAALAFAADESAGEVVSSPNALEVTAETLAAAYGNGTSLEWGADWGDAAAAAAREANGDPTLSLAHVARNLAGTS